VCADLPAGVVVADTSVTASDEGALQTQAASRHCQKKEGYQDTGLAYNADGCESLCVDCIPAGCVMQFVHTSARLCLARVPVSGQPLTAVQLADKLRLSPADVASWHCRLNLLLASQIVVHYLQGCGVRLGCGQALTLLLILQISALVEGQMRLFLLCPRELSAIDAIRSDKVSSPRRMARQ
jgi:hypothetical protein